jgi:hypothetical protein
MDYRFMVSLWNKSRSFCVDRTAADRQITNEPWSSMHETKESEESEREKLF